MIHPDISQSLTCQQDEDGQHGAVPFHVGGSGNQLQLLWFVVCCFRYWKRRGRLVLVLLLLWLCINSCENKRKKGKTRVFKTAPITHTCVTHDPPKCEKFTALVARVFCFVLLLFSSFSPTLFSCCCSLLFCFFSLAFSTFLIFSLCKRCSSPSGQITTMHCTLTKQFFGHFFVFPSCLVEKRTKLVVISRSKKLQVILGQLFKRKFQ